MALLVLTGSCAPGSGGGAEVTLEERPPSRESAEWAGLRYAIALRASGLDRLRLRATVTNVSSGFREQELPFCLIQARLYRDGRLAWSQAEDEGCGGALRVLRLGPGETRSFSRTLTAGRVLGDSLPPGAYRLRARLPGSDRPGLPRAEMSFDLGTVTLEPPPADTAGGGERTPANSAGTAGLVPPRATPRPPPRARGPGPAPAHHRPGSARRTSP